MQGRDVGKNDLFPTAIMESRARAEGWRCRHRRVIAALGPHGTAAEPVPSDATVLQSVRALRREERLCSARATITATMTAVTT